MKALVVGASGLVGGALYHILRTRNHEVVGTYNKFAFREFTQLDLANEPEVDTILDKTRPDWIFCPAGLTNVDACEGRLGEIIPINRDQVVRLAKKGDQIGAGFVFYSTEYVFDGKKGPYSETDKPNPINDYGMSKLLAENAIREQIKKWIIVRTVGVYGPELQRKNFIYRVLQMKGTSQQRMFVPNDQVSTPTYNIDLATASSQLVEMDQQGIFNITGPELIDRYQFALLACREFGISESSVMPVETASLGQKAPRPLWGGLRTEKLISLIKTNLQTPAKALAAFHKEIGDK